MVKLTKAGAVYSMGQLRADNPNTSFPADLTGVDLSAWGVSVVAEVPQPTPAPYQHVTEGAPSQVNGVWTQTWTTGNLALAQAKLNLDAVVDLALNRKIVFPGATCITPIGTVACDHASRIDIIMNMVMAVQLGAGFSVSWPLADGSTVLLNAAKMLQLGQAVATYVTACQTNARSLKSKITNAATVQIAAAIDTSVGWP